MNERSFDMYWIFEKVRGDQAIYGICPKCEFHYAAGEASKKRVGQYRYCPMCGEYLFNNNTDIKIIWDKRDLMDFHRIDTKG